MSERPTNPPSPQSRPEAATTPALAVGGAQGPEAAERTYWLAHASVQELAIIRKNVATLEASPRLDKAVDAIERAMLYLSEIRSAAAREARR